MDVTGAVLRCFGSEIRENLPNKRDFDARREKKDN